jgi:hypothetical protein
MPGKSATLQFLTGPANPPVTLVAEIVDNTAQGNTQQLFCLVLPDNYYQCHIPVAGPTLVVWVEYS